METSEDVATSRHLTPSLKYENNEECLLFDFQLEANALDGVGNHLAPHLNNKSSISDELHLSSITSHHAQSFHSTELQNNPSSDEMRVRFGNWHLSNNTKQQSTEEKCDLTIASKSNSLSFSPIQLHRMSIGEPLFSCPVCSRRSMTIIETKVHAKIHHNETHPFPCTVCKQKFDNHSALIQHMYSHGMNPTFKCELCGATFDHLTGLLRHNWFVHYEIFGLKPSSAARKRSASKSTLSALSSRTEEPSTSVTPQQCRDEPLFPCVFCGKKFGKKALLSQHMKSHEFRTTYVCEICGQIFNFQSSLSKHRSVHFVAVRHASSLCDMTFPHRNDLNRHQATHLKSTDVKLQTKKTPRAIPRTEPNPRMFRRKMRQLFSVRMTTQVQGNVTFFAHDPDLGN